MPRAIFLPPLPLLLSSYWRTTRLLKVRARVTPEQPHANDARALEAEINSYNNDLQQNHAEAIAKVNKWWNTTADWGAYRNA